MIPNRLFRWLRAPLAMGWLALVCGVAAVAVPTIIRVAVNGVITGCEFTPYLPFVLLSAFLLRWWQAGLVALAAIAILGGLFLGPPNEHLDTECFVSSAGIFLAATAMMIGIAVLVRRLIAASQDRGADESSGGIVFSLEEGQVWASWYGQGAPVNLGSQRRVAEMMEDFLAQVEVGKRLNRKSR